MRLFNINFIILFLSLLACQSCFAAHGWFRFQKNGLMGFKDASGKIIIPAKYKMAQYPVDGIAAVMDDKGWVYINKKGRKLMRPLIFDNGPDYFVEGLSRYKYKNKIGFIDKHGKIVIKAIYDFVFPFHEGYAVYCQNCKSVPIEGDYHIMKGGIWGCIDKKGHDVSLNNCHARAYYINK